MARVFSLKRYFTELGRAVVGQAARDKRAGLRRSGEFSNFPSTMGGGYQAAQLSRLLDDWFGSILSPDEEAKQSGQALRMRSRDLEKNNVLYTNWIELTKDGVLGPNGFTLEGMIVNANSEPATKINESVERAYNDWWKNPTVDGRTTGNAFERMSFGCMIRDGEGIARKIKGFNNAYGFALQGLDPDLLHENFHRDAGGLGQNEIRCSVEIDQWGAPVAYWFANRAEGSVYGGYSGWGVERTRVPADEICHAFVAKRPNQRRGVAWGHASMVQLQQIGMFVFAEVVASRMGASVFAEYENTDPSAPDLGSLMTPTGPAGASSDPASGRAGFRQQFDPGTVGVSPKGYHLNFHDPKHPNTDAPAFLTAMGNLANSGLPASDPHALMSDYSRVNFTSSRAAQLVVMAAVASIQNTWVGAFRLPTYKAWLPMAWAAGKVRLDSRPFEKFYDVRFSAATQRTVQPREEAEAAILEIGAGITTVTDVLAKRGQAIEDVLKRRAKEIALGKSYGIDLEAPIAAFGAGKGAANAESQAAAGGSDAAQAAPAKTSGKKPKASA